MPRIRTVKPEFWRNKQLAKLPEFTRLLAIALLNYSDDEGFFDHDEDLIRGECFPYEPDSSRVTVGLRELSGIGYVDARNVDGKCVGVICKFKEHQVVNKAKKSKLKIVFESAAAASKSEAPSDETGTVPDSYRNDTERILAGKERKGAGNREQGGGKENPLDFSKHGKDDAFRSAWKCWVGKQSVNRPNGLDHWTEMGQLKDLERFKTEDAVAIVEYSTSRTNCINLITNGDHAVSNGRKQKSTFEELGI